jgi:pantoate--beta-alanine ligase
MECIREIADIRSRLDVERGKGKTIGLVPTMGYFHQGHLSLMEQARDECDVLVTSLYVNPTQFAPSEDLDSYPRDLARDVLLAEKAGVDFLFCPADSDIYGSGHSTYIEVERLNRKLCGKSRPSHFRGVATIVAKLFNIVKPDQAYFGQKDAQQVAVIKKMVEDLNFDLKIKVVPTKRDQDGLAMSSRNSYLSASDRKEALVLYESLVRAKDLVAAGERTAGRIRKEMHQIISGKPGVELEYISICDNNTLEEVAQIDGEILIALAAKVGKARLIDNIVVRA